LAVQVIAESATHRITYSSSKGALMMISWSVEERRGKNWQPVEMVHSRNRLDTAAGRYGLTIIGDGYGT
jgi:hypothetical protein